MTLIGEYLPPPTLEHLPDLEELLNCFPGRDPIVLGNPNAYPLDTVYCKAAFGITLHAMRQHSPCPGDPRGRVGLVSHEQPEGWIVESMHFHGPNVVICKVVSGNQ